MQIGLGRSRSVLIPHSFCNCVSVMAKFSGVEDVLVPFGGPYLVSIIFVRHSFPGSGRSCVPVRLPSVQGPLGRDRVGPAQFFWSIRLVEEAVAQNMSLVRTHGQGHPNVFPSCGGLPLLSRLNYISRMRNDIFQSLTRSAVSSGFRWVPEGASSSGQWVGKLWSSFFELYDRVPVSYPLLITLSILAGADQDLPPRSLIDSILLAVPVASPTQLLSVALEAKGTGPRRRQ